MEVIRGTEWERSIPDPDRSQRRFFEAAARGELVYQRCPACDHAQFYPRAVCTACGADPEWATASGRGSVHTFTIVRQNFMKPFADELPYVVAMIELEEGVRMMTNVTGCDPETVAIGMRVRADFVATDDQLGVPRFVPA